MPLRRQRLGVRPLHLPPRPRSRRPVRPHLEAPVPAEALELRVRYQPPSALPTVLDHHRLHLVEEQLLRNGTEVPERRFHPPYQHRQRLSLVVANPQEPRMPPHHHQRLPLPPRQPELREVHLALVPRRGLEPHDRLRTRPRPTSRTLRAGHPAGLARDPGAAGVVGVDQATLRASDGSLILTRQDARVGPEPVEIAPAMARRSRACTATAAWYRK